MNLDPELREFVRYVAEGTWRSEPRITCVEDKAKALLAKLPQPADCEVLEAIEQAIALIQEAKGADGPNGGFVTDHLDFAESWLNKVIAKLSPPPVDPDIEEARKLVAERYDSEFGAEAIIATLRGDDDDTPAVQNALTALKRGRSLERGE